MKKLPLSILWVVFSLALVACAPTPPASEAPTAGVSFRPIAAIVDQPLQVTGFRNNGTATLPVETNIPVACSVVYGKTPAFGSLSLDQDMAGGAHTDHQPMLAGLEPETTYYFRVQGVDAEGVVYLSDVLTFTTPAQADAPAVENLASPLLGAEIIGYSSTFGDAAPSAAWGTANAFDDNPNTAWSSSGDGDQAWVAVQLAHPARVTAVSFHSRSMADGSAVTLAFQIKTGTGQVLGPFEVPSASQPFKFETSFEAQTLRFELINTTGGNTGAVDIVVLGEFIQ